MQVYRAYFKIVRRHLPSLAIYLAISLILFVIISSSLKSQSSAQFNETKSSIAIMNSDVSSPLISGLEDYLSSKAAIVRINDNPDDIQDALFYGNVSYVLRIPQGFSQSFLSGDGRVSLEKSTSDNSASSVSLDLYINKYLNLAGLYVRNAPNLQAGEIVSDVLRDLGSSSDAVYTANLEQTTTHNLSFYFRLIAYSILSIMISGVTSIMMSFNRREFSMRNLCSPMSARSMNLQMVLANAVFAAVVWLTSCAFIFITYGRFMLTAGILLMCLNALIFTVASLGIGFLAGKFVRTHIAQAALTNVVALGTSFLCGVFVSQALLGKTVLRLASFTPGYWYIKAVQDIAGLSAYSFGNLTPVINSMLIQLGFALVFIVIALAATRQRRSESAF